MSYLHEWEAYVLKSPYTLAPVPPAKPRYITITTRRYPDLRQKEDIERYQAYLRQKAEWERWGKQIYEVQPKLAYEFQPPRAGPYYQPSPYITKGYHTPYSLAHPAYYYTTPTGGMPDVSALYETWQKEYEVSAKKQYLEWLLQPKVPEGYKQVFGGVGPRGPEYFLLPSEEPPKMPPLEATWMGTGPEEAKYFKEHKVDIILHGWMPPKEGIQALKEPTIITLRGGEEERTLEYFGIPYEKRVTYPTYDVGKLLSVAPHPELERTYAREFRVPQVYPFVVEGDEVKRLVTAPTRGATVQLLTLSSYLRGKERKEVVAHPEYERAIRGEGPLSGPVGAMAGYVAAFDVYGLQDVATVNVRIPKTFVGGWIAGEATQMYLFWKGTTATLQLVDVALKKFWKTPIEVMFQRVYVGPVEKPTEEPFTVLTRSGGRWIRKPLLVGTEIKETFKPYTIMRTTGKRGVGMMVIQKQTAMQTTLQKATLAPILREQFLAERAALGLAQLVMQQQEAKVLLKPKVKTKVSLETKEAMKDVTVSSVVIPFWAKSMVKWVGPSLPPLVKPSEWGTIKLKPYPKQKFKIKPFPIQKVPEQVRVEVKAFQMEELKQPQLLKEVQRPKLARVQLVMPKMAQQLKVQQPLLQKQILQQIQIQQPTFPRRLRKLRKKRRKERRVKPLWGEWFKREHAILTPKQLRKRLGFNGKRKKRRKLPYVI